MTSRTLSPVLLVLLSLSLALAQTGDNELYIERYQQLAIEEMERSGVPASIKMAQALLESAAGSSDLALIANNHFGIKCGGSWSGKTYKKHDDEFTSLGLPKKSCFRSYSSVEESFRAHSDFLRDNRRYRDLFQLDVTNYKRWAKELRKAGYATSPTYHKKLIDLIERYELSRLDRMHPGIPILADEDRGENPGASPVAGALPAELSYHNDVRCIIAKRQETVVELAGLMDVSLRDILRYNEHITSPDQFVDPGERVYTQPKRRHYRGRDKWHQVQVGETMLDISNRYGISLRHLYKRNRIFPGNEPTPDSRIKIRGGKVDMPPALAGEDRQRSLPEEEETPKLDFEIESKRGAGASYRGGDRVQTSGGEGTDARHRNLLIDTRQTLSTGIAPRPDAGAAPALHEVRPGETLWSISRRYGTTVERLKALNGLAPGAVLLSGMQLKVR